MEQINPRRHRHHDNPANRPNESGKYDETQPASSDYARRRRGISTLVIVDVAPSAGVVSTTCSLRTVGAKARIATGVGTQEAACHGDCRFGSCRQPFPTPLIGLTPREPS